jgi:hypothetical protein
MLLGSMHTRKKQPGVLRESNQKQQLRCVIFCFYYILLLIWNLLHVYMWLPKLFAAGVIIYTPAATSREACLILWEAYKTKEESNSTTCSATEPVPAPHQASAQHKVPAHRQCATASHVPSASRPFIPPKQKQLPSSSQPLSQASASQSSSQPSSQVARRETIPMSDVVTQALPKEGRLKWYLLGNQNGGARGEGED